MTGTLIEAAKRGMRLHFVTREQYRNKNDISFTDLLREQFGEFYLVPEGGNNEDGISGCRDIVDPAWKYDHVFCACGTGATFAGIVATPGFKGLVTGISVLKGINSLPGQVEQTLETMFPAQKYLVKGNEILENKTIGSHCIINSFALNGYAGFHPALISFKKEFENEYKIPLDHIYTAKLFFAANQILRKGMIEKGKSVLIVHTGGLQGNAAFEERYQLKLSR